MAHCAFRSRTIPRGPAWSEGFVGHKHRHGRCPLLILERDLATVFKNEQNQTQYAFTLLLRSGFQIRSAGTASRNELHSFPSSLGTPVRKGLNSSTRCC